MNDKDKKDKQKSKPLPLWSKAIIASTGIGIALVMTTIISTMVGLRELVTQAQNPIYMEQVAQSIAAFPQPLPAGYKYYCALDVLGLLKLLAVDYADGKRQQQIMFISYMIDNQNPEEQIDASKLVKEVYNNGLNTFKVHSKFATIETEGCWTIQGFMIPYQIGKLQDVKGTGLVACLVNELQKKVVLFYVAQLDSPDGKSADGNASNSKVVSVNESTASSDGKPATGAADGTDATIPTTGAAGAAGTTGSAGTSDATGAGATGTTSTGTDKDQPEPFDMHVITNLLQDVKGF